MWLVRPFENDSSFANPRTRCLSAPMEETLEWFLGFWPIGDGLILRRFELLALLVLLSLRKS